MVNHVVVLLVAVQPFVDQVVHLADIPHQPPAMRLQGLGFLGFRVAPHRLRTGRWALGVHG